MRLPVAADFTSPPSARQRRAWEEADRAARPARRARLRSRFAAANVDAYFGLRREEIRYLTGVALGEGEEKVAGHSGQFLVSADGVVVLADSRYTLQARREASDARVEAVTYDLPARWAELCASIGAVVSIARSMTPISSQRSLRSSSLPRLMRETSSKSSMRRTM